MPNSGHAEQPLQLLVVCADETSRERLTRSCSELNAVVREASTVDTAHELIDAMEPDAVFVDVVSTGPRDSVSFVQHVRHSRPRVVFVLYNDEEELSQHADTLYWGWGARLRQYFTQPRTVSDERFVQVLTFNVRRRVPIDLLIYDAEAAATGLQGVGYTPDQVAKFQSRAERVRRTVPTGEAAEAASGRVKPYGFVIRAYDESLDDAFDHGIVPTLTAAGLDALLATDEYAVGESLIDKTFRLVRLARIVVADLSIERPNCFYELGFADALGKPTVLLARNDTPIPLELAGREILHYGSSRQLVPKLSAALQDALGDR